MALITIMASETVYCPKCMVVWKRQYLSQHYAVMHAGSLTGVPTSTHEIVFEMSIRSGYITHVADLLSPIVFRPEEDPE